LVVFKHFGIYLPKSLAISDLKIPFIISRIKNKNCDNLSMELSMYPNKDVTKSQVFNKYIQNQDKIQHKQKLKKQKTSIEVDGMI
jgi:hypothetical protein